MLLLFQVRLFFALLFVIWAPLYGTSPKKLVIPHIVLTQPLVSAKSTGDLSRYPKLTAANIHAIAQNLGLGKPTSTDRGKKCPQANTPFLKLLKQYKNDPLSKQIDNIEQLLASAQSLHPSMLAEVKFRIETMRPLVFQKNGDALQKKYTFLIKLVETRYQKRARYNSV